MKALIALFALAFFGYAPYFYLTYKDQYSGPRPPAVPLIHSLGMLKYVPWKTPTNIYPQYIEFETDQGTVYDVGYKGDAAIGQLVNWLIPRNPRRVYLEGFLLRDGKGPLWPTYIASPQGATLVSRTRLNRLLIRYRGSAMGGARDLYYIDLLFVVVTVFNMYQLRRRSSITKN